MSAQISEEPTQHKNLLTIAAIVLAVVIVLVVRTRRSEKSNATPVGAPPETAGEEPGPDTSRGRSA
jgi:hypothetical protein